MTVKELCFFTEGFREPVVGVNRYGRKIAISLLSRLYEECFLACVVEYGCPVIGFGLKDMSPRGIVFREGTISKVVPRMIFRP